MASPITETPILLGEDAETFYRNKAKVESEQDPRRKEEERARVMSNYDKVRAIIKVDR